MEYKYGKSKALYGITTFEDIFGVNRKCLIDYTNIEISDKLEYVVNDAISEEKVENMSEYNSKVIRKYMKFHGMVQGVGFRYRAEHAANLVGATGWVRNDPDGSVSMEIQGTEEQIDKVIIMIEKGSYIDIQRMDAKSINVIADERGFKTRR